MTTVAPQILWAQRSSDVEPSKNILFITIAVPDLEPQYTLDIASNKLTFVGKSITQADKTYRCELDLYGEVETEEGKKLSVTGKDLFLTLQKKVLTEEYWPRLSKDKRVNYIKTNFALWRDEDEQDGEEAAEPAAGPGGGGGDFDMANMMQSMGGGGGGMPGMGGGAGGFDMEALMAQMKASGGGAGGMPKFDEDDADDELPSLDTTGSSKGKGKADDDEGDDDMPPLE